MRCSEVRDLLHAFLDGELEVDRNVVMLKHLELCAPCRERSEGEERLRGMVVRACSEPLPAERVRALIAAACSRSDAPLADEAGGAVDGPAGAFAEPTLALTPRPARRRGPLLAAAAGVLLAAGAGVWGLHLPCRLGDCGPRGLLAVARETTVVEPAMPMDDLYARLGERFTPPARAGLTLVGGNALTVEGRPVPLLRYRCNCDGREVVVARVPAAHVHDWDMERLTDGRRYVVAEQTNGAKLVGWFADDGRLWCVIGCPATPRERLYVLASAMRD